MPGVRIHVPTADAPLKIEEEQKQQAMLDVFSARYGTPRRAAASAPAPAPAGMPTGRGSADPLLPEEVPCVVAAPARCVDGSLDARAGAPAAANGLRDEANRRSRLAAESRRRRAAAIRIQAAVRSRLARRLRRRLAAAAAEAATQQKLAQQRAAAQRELQAKRAREEADNTQQAELQQQVGSVVASWQSAHGPALRDLLAALDAPELTRHCGACAEARQLLPPGSDAAATRRAYLLAIKRVHPDKLGAGASMTERVAAAAIFDVLRDAQEREAEAASLLLASKNERAAAAAYAKAQAEVQKAAEKAAQSAAERAARKSRSKGQSDWAAEWAAAEIEAERAVAQSATERAARKSRPMGEGLGQSGLDRLWNEGRTVFR